MELPLLFQVLANSLPSASVYALVASGFSLIYATTRFYHFAHAAVYTVATYVAYTVSEQYSLGWGPGLAAGIVAAAGLGAVLELSIYHPLRQAGATADTKFIVSLGLLMVLQNSVSLLYGDAALRLHRPAADHLMTFCSIQLTHGQMERVLISTVVAVSLYLTLRYSHFGITVRATASNPDLAHVIGIQTQRVNLWVFLIGSALCGLGGILLAQDLDVRPETGLRVFLVAVVASTVGGVGSLPGAFLGALLVAVVQNLSAWLLPNQWSDPVLFLMLAFALVARPQGILGRRD